MNCKLRADVAGFCQQALHRVREALQRCKAVLVRLAPHSEAGMHRLPRGPLTGQESPLATRTALRRTPCTGPMSATARAAQRRLWDQGTWCDPVSRDPKILDQHIRHRFLGDGQAVAGHGNRQRRIPCCGDAAFCEVTPNVRGRFARRPRSRSRPWPSASSSSGRKCNRNWRLAAAKQLSITLR